MPRCSKCGNEKGKVVEMQCCGVHLCFDCGLKQIQTGCSNCHASIPHGFERFLRTAAAQDMLDQANYLRSIGSSSVLIRGLSMNAAMAMGSINDEILISRAYELAIWCALRESSLEVDDVISRISRPSPDATTTTTKHKGTTSVRISSSSKGFGVGSGIVSDESESVSESDDDDDNNVESEPKNKQEVDPIAQLNNVHETISRALENKDGDNEDLVELDERALVSLAYMRLRIGDISGYLNAITNLVDLRINHSSGAYSLIIRLLKLWASRACASRRRGDQKAAARCYSVWLAIYNQLDKLEGGEGEGEGYKKRTGHVVTLLEGSMVQRRVGNKMEASEMLIAVLSALNSTDHTADAESTSDPDPTVVEATSKLLALLLLTGSSRVLSVIDRREALKQLSIANSGLDSSHLERLGAALESCDVCGKALGGVRAFGFGNGSWRFCGACQRRQYCSKKCESMDMDKSPDSVHGAVCSAGRDEEGEGEGGNGKWTTMRWIIVILMLSVTIGELWGSIEPILRRFLYR